jgi:hypothetical protein
MTSATDTPEVVEGKATELARPIQQPAQMMRPAPPSTLWRTDDPAVVVQRATALADAIAPLIQAKGWAQNFGGDRDHLQIEAWQTLGSMAGVFTTQPVNRELPWPADEHLTDQLRQVRDAGYVFGYEVEYAARTLGGAVCGGANGVCKRTEENWCFRKDKVVDDYALLGMAQTRAQSRTFASPLRFVVELAGFSGTPAEEMQPGMASANGGGERVGFGSDKQRGFMQSLLGEKGLDGPAVELVLEYAGATMSGSRGGGISNAIDALKGSGQTQAQAAQELLAAAKAWNGQDAGADAPPEVHEPADPLPDARVEELMKGLEASGIGFARFGAIMGSLGAERPSINRQDSWRKSLRALSAEKADRLEAKINSLADGGQG